MQSADRADQNCAQQGPASKAQRSYPLPSAAAAVLSGVHKRCQQTAATSKPLIAWARGRPQGNVRREQVRGHAAAAAAPKATMTHRRILSLDSTAPRTATRHSGRISFINLPTLRSLVRQARAQQKRPLYAQSCRNGWRDFFLADWQGSCSLQEGRRSAATALMGKTCAYLAGFPTASGRPFIPRLCPAIQAVI